MATFIPTDSTQPTREVQPANPRQGFQLKELYTLLGCTMIEVVNLPGGERIMIIDEEGKLDDKPRNERATQLAGFATPAQLTAWLLKLRNQGVEVIQVGGQPLTDETTETDWIVGDVLICNDNELQ